MSKYSGKKIQWLLGEVRDLRKEGVIDEGTETKLLGYYQGRIDLNSAGKTVSSLLTVLASLFVIGGIILLIGFNWHAIPQMVKTGLVSLLTLVPMGICFYRLFISRNPMTSGLREGLSLFWALGFGATVAAVGQIYNLPQNNEVFLLTWSLSSLLIIYMMDSISVVIVYLVLIIGYCTALQIDSKIGLYFAPLFLALVPHYLRVYRKESQVRSTLYNYFLIFGLSTGLGISLEKNVPGLWIIAYSSLFSIFYIYSLLFENKDREESLFYSPSLIAGVTGTAVLAFLFSWQWPWHDIGWRFYRHDSRFHELASIYDYVLTSVLWLSSIGLLILSIVRKKMQNIVIASFGLVMALLYVFISFNEISLLASWGTNLFILCLCINAFYNGYRSKSLLSINAGMVFLTITIVSRFFDEYLSLFWRGIIFIVCGILIYIVNRTLSKNFKAKGKSL
jgi:uncharacterized membrane protein